MKRKDLYNYIREEIINELTLSEDTIQYTDSQGKDSIANIDVNSVEGKKSVDTLKKASDVKMAINTTKNQKIKEGDIEEARKGSNIKVGTNFAAIKNAYAGSIIERILNKIEEAGDNGITPKEIMVAVGIKAPSQLNPIMRELMELGAISGPAPKEVEAEPEETTPEDDLANLGIPKVTDNPEDKEVDDDELVAVEKDEWEKPEEEEDSTEEEPKVADIKAADKEAEKIAGGKGYAKKLSPEDEEKYTKIKKGIDAKISKLLAMNKAKRIESDDFKILKQLVSRDDVKKLFKDKGVSLKDVLADIMG